MYIDLGMAYQRNFYGDQYVFINGNELKGVQSFNGSWSIPQASMTAAGYEYIGTEIEGDLSGEISIDRLTIDSNDPIINLLGQSFYGELIYGPENSKNKSFYFDKGYINSYESNCSIGEIAQSNFSILAYGNIGSTSSLNSKKGTASYTAPSPKIASANSMTLSTSFDSTNAVQSYSFKVDMDVNPIYKMGNMFIPSKFEISTPIVVSTDFEIFANDYEVKNLYNGICSNSFKEDLFFSLNEKCGGSEISSFTLNNAELTASSISAGIGNNLSISLSFENKFDDISTLVSNVF